MNLKKLNYELVPVGTEPDDPYKLLERARELWHGDLAEARIALAWRREWAVDKDGHLVLGKCHKVSDLHKELEDFDFIIVLNREIWHDSDFTEDKKLALLDHELSHAAVAFDGEGNPQRDQRGRMVFRIRKHDIEEFRSVVEHHGCYKRDLQEFAESILRKQKTGPLFRSGEGARRQVDVQ